MIGAMAPDFQSDLNTPDGFSVVIKSICNHRILDHAKPVSHEMELNQLLTTCDSSHFIFCPCVVCAAYKHTVPLAATLYIAFIIRV